MIKKKHIALFTFLLFSFGNHLLAQENPDAIALVDDQLENNFYEAVKQRGIENYDKAIVAIQKCIEKEPKNAAFQYELGKNYLSLKNYVDAESAFKKAVELDNKQRWYWNGLYDVYYQTKDYQKSIPIVEKLIEFDGNMREDLVSLYMYTQQFDKALVLIDELNEKVGKSEMREMYKTQILSQGKFQNAEIDNLLNQIKLNPKTEFNYITLIKLYSDKNETQKAAEITKKLETEIPGSEWAQVGLFKNYLDKNEAQKAINSMNVVLSSTQIDAKIKYRVLDEFMTFVNKNPQYSSDLEKAISLFSKDSDANITKKIAKYYYSKKQWDKAIFYYEQSLKNNSVSDVETNILLLQSYVEIKQFENVSKKAATLVEIYPTQPHFYYYSALANNQLKQYKKAIEMLEMGMDYVVEDVQLEINFNLQLGEAHNGLGDFKKREQYFTKANQLLKAKK